MGGYTKPTSQRGAGVPGHLRTDEELTGSYCRSLAECSGKFYQIVTYTKWKRPIYRHSAEAREAELQKRSDGNIGTLIFTSSHIIKPGRLDEDTVHLPCTSEFVGSESLWVPRTKAATYRHLSGSGTPLHFYMCKVWEINPFIPQPNIWASAQ